ncbi:histidine kinase dimerization/phosphoacceptor domain -containing protein [Sphingomonas sp. ST-64]|uniref:histidine kinase n=1 Tax=Sphingomonas plantiphila TaxID=3163295 RepID=A0ABW8YQB1_9SPHN
MDGQDLSRRGGGGPVAALARMPTGAKVFLILSAALLPFALVAFLASLQSTRLADQEVRARLRIAIGESARSLRSELSWETRELASALPTDPGQLPNCGRLAGIFEPQAVNGIRYVVLDPQRRVICGVPLPSVTGEDLRAEEPLVRLVPDSGLQIEVAGAAGHVARAFFPRKFLATAAEPSAMARDFGTLLSDDERDLTLTSLDGPGLLGRTEKQTVDLGLHDLRLQMTVASAPVTSSAIISALSPFLMWFLAAGIAWFVVDRLLIRPLRRLRTTVEGYQPGEVIDPIAGSEIPAQEIRALGDTFRELSQTVQLHEHDLAEGLSRQTKLTREVHHRVKNNLQVIASLINFHSRSALGPDALAAYASIQRRVDALAVVHRHHYAGFEDTRGIELRSVIGELASNLRATAPEGSPVGIRIDIAPLLVSQDSAVAIAFLITEIVELAMLAGGTAQINISTKQQDDENAALLRISSPALIESAKFADLYQHRYGRIIGGLVRQLRSQLHHDPMVGAFEIVVAVNGPA